MTLPDTKQRLLDAAERLFADEGFHNTSLRAITGRANVNLAAVNYHFGSKEALLDAVIERRLSPLNAVRRENLEAVRGKARDAGRRPKTEETLRAFVEPTLRFRESGPGAEAFITLLGRILAEPDASLRELFIRRIKPLFLLLFQILRESLPQLDERTLFWRLQFILGAMGHTMCWAGRFGELPEELPAPGVTTETLVRMLLDFLTAGLEAPCATANE
ncbi:TetR/AcrR family transcriptional regulator [Desulfuromonas sp. TF]|jgi:AcrR family transcriptional regulator|uniref:TetR/AcrR family transcriptional regulator n=1 Tax=Desulfuromonas sp. TF TaxID=1232410 RepID=UPI00040C43EA|nr:TetR/AcrR family transcriptional regulator [Desulfuromonas sp. TF]